MSIKDLILSNRSYRRFDESRKITRNELADMVDCARCSASAANRQPLKYLLSWTKEMNDLVFPVLGWAGYLKDWGGPRDGEKPAGYIVLLNDTKIHSSASLDPGIACQSILLRA